MSLITTQWKSLWREQNQSSRFTTVSANIPLDTSRSKNKKLWKKIARVLFHFGQQTAATISVSHNIQT